MNTLREAVHDYIDMRRNLGFKLNDARRCQVQFKTDPGFAFKIDPPFPGFLLSSDIGRRAGDGGNWPQASPLRAQASPTRISTPRCTR